MKRKMKFTGDIQLRNHGLDADIVFGIVSKAVEEIVPTKYWPSVEEYIHVQCQQYVIGVCISAFGDTINVRVSVICEVPTFVLRKPQYDHYFLNGLEPLFDTESLEIFDFEAHQARLAKKLDGIERVTVFATGPTPLAIEVINHCRLNGIVLEIYHYNEATNNFVSQWINTYTKPKIKKKRRK